MTIRSKKTGSAFSSVLRRLCRFSFSSLWLWFALLVPVVLTIFIFAGKGDYPLILIVPYTVALIAMIVIVFFIVHAVTFTALLIARKGSFTKTDKVKYLLTDLFFAGLTYLIINPPYISFNFG